MQLKKERLEQVAGWANMKELQGDHSQTIKLGIKLGM
jgi:hypothetical protein